MLKFFLAAIAAFTFGASTGAAQALTLLSAGAFASGDTRIDIEVTNGDRIAGQLPGLFFSGDAFGRSGDAAALFGDDLVGSNIGPQGPWEIFFDLSIVRFGMNAVTNVDDDIQVTAFRGDVSLGTVMFVTDLTVRFFGLGDVGGFNRLQFTPAGSSNGAAAYDNLVFGTSAVPVPAASWLMVACLGAFGFSGWRRRQLARRPE